VASLLETHPAAAKARCRCGHGFEAVVVETIDLSRDSRLMGSPGERERLRRVSCPACGAPVEVEAPLYLHDPAARRFFCVLPESQRPREIELRIEFLRRLLDEGGAAVPAYVREARFLYDLESIPADAIAAPAPAAAPPADGGAGAPARVAELSESDFEEVVDAEALARRDAAIVERWKESGQSHYMFWDGHALNVFQRLARPELIGERGDLLFQLHRGENFPVIVLLFVAESGGRPRQVLTWPFNLDNRVDVGFLENLARHFEVRLHLFDTGFRRQRLMALAPPLHKNVAYVLAEARRWLAQIEPGRRNFFLAVSKLDEGAYLRLGERPAALLPEAFSDLPTPSVTRLSLQILTHWSTRKNYEYLIFVKSFPVTTFQAILREVLGRAIHFGLAMSQKMQRLSIELGLAPDLAALHQMLFANFERVVAGERANDLDLEAQLENWRDLCDGAERAGLAVEQRHRERIRQLERQRDEAQNLIPIELVGDVQMLDDLRELSAEELTALLSDPEHRLEALRILCEAGSGGEIEAIEPAVIKMKPREADGLQDALARLGPQARPMLERLSGHAVASAARAGLRGMARLLGPASAGILLREVAAGRRAVWKVAADLLAALPEVDSEALLSLESLARGEGRNRLLQTLERARCPALREWAEGARGDRGPKKS